MTMHLPRQFRPACDAFHLCKKLIHRARKKRLPSNRYHTSDKGVVVSRDGRTTIATKPSPSVAREASSDAGLVTIFNNIGSAYPKGTYWCCEGYTITGPTALSGFPEFWEAGAFTSKADRIVTKVKVAVGWVEGTNGLVLGLYNDANGVPGTAIKAYSVTNLPTFGSCCSVEAKMDSAGIPVKAHTQYWIVLKTNSKESTTWAAFNVNDTEQIDPAPTAFYCSQDKGGSCSTNDAWTAGNSVPGLRLCGSGKVSSCKSLASL